MKNKNALFISFLSENNFVILQNEVLISTSFLCILKEKLNAFISNQLQSQNVPKITTPNFLKENFIFNEKEDNEKYKILNLPSITYSNGERLSKAYVIPNSTIDIGHLIFKKTINSEQQLPFKFYSKNIEFNTSTNGNYFINLVEQNIIEINWFDIHSNLNYSLKKITSLILSLLQKLLKLSYNIKYHSDNIGFDITYLNKIIIKVSYFSKVQTKELGLFFTEKSGKTASPFHVNIQLNEYLFWSVLYEHFDDLGFKLPDLFLNFTIVIIPIYKKNGIATRLIEKLISKTKLYLNHHLIEYHIDNSNLSIGEKFFKWEKIGIPIRIEIGENESSLGKLSIFNRYTKEKKMINIDMLHNELVSHSNYWK